MQPDNHNTAPSARRHTLSEAARLAELRKFAGDGLKFILPLGISVALVLWLCHRVDIHTMVQTIRHGCDYRWIVLMMAITTLSHIIRGIRWGIQLRGVGIPRMSVTAESVSIFGAYALNLIFSGLGEAWRCIYITRREHASFLKVVGTDLGDRSSDAVMVILITLVAVIVAQPALVSFADHYAVGRDIKDVLADPWTWCIAAAVIGCLWTILHFCRHYRVVENVDDGIDRMWDGFKVLFTMKGRGMYLVLTIGIWTCYFLETYVCFYAFPFTRELIHQPGMAYGLVPGLVAFVFGSFSMAVPSNGGLGPWNLAVMFALSLFGIGQADAAAFTVVMWTFQAAMLVMLGLFSAAYIFFTKDKDPEPSSTSTSPSPISASKTSASAAEVSHN